MAIKNTTDPSAWCLEFKLKKYLLAKEVIIYANNINQKESLDRFLNGSLSYFAIFQASCQGP